MPHPAFVEQCQACFLFGVIRPPFFFFLGTVKPGGRWISIMKGRFKENLCGWCLFFSHWQFKLIKLK